MTLKLLRPKQRENWWVGRRWECQHCQAIMEIESVSEVETAKTSIEVKCLGCSQQIRLEQNSKEFMLAMGYQRPAVNGKEIPWDSLSTRKLRLMYVVLNALSPEISGRDAAIMFRRYFGKKLSYGTVYVLFRELTEMGMISSRDGSDQDGRVRWFSLTEEGRSVVMDRLPELAKSVVSR